ncbi:hypothetical protein [Paenarthrobacter nicotinovorans]|uniref:hypothetical protein n=1 Tax=Paenarthrobacter nicotinovorans TaxID=29320 RepID=UPI0012DD2CF1|nr:hypothetical protein [Paenarthrobacter nicotinovorans]
MDICTLGPVGGDVWKWVAANSGPLGLLVAVVSAVIALSAVVRTAKDSHNRSRPMVVAEFQFAKDSPSHLDLVIRNYGPTIARNLSVEFDRHITDDSGDEWTIGQLMYRRYAGTTFHSFSPNQEFRNVWWRGQEVSGQRRQVNAFDTPESVTVALRYQDPKGKKYREEFELETGSFLLSTTATASTSLLGRLKTIDASLSKLAHSSQRLAAAVEEQDSGRGERLALAAEETAALLRKLGFDHAQENAPRPNN